MTPRCWTRLRAAALALLASACGDDATVAHADPFEVRATFAMLRSGRALAVTHRAETTFAIAVHEFESQVEVVALAGGEWTGGERVSVAEGPRAICAFESSVLVASASDPSVTAFELDDDGHLTVRAVLALDAAPSAIACADFDEDGALDAIVTVGSGDAGEVRVLRASENGLDEVRRWPFASASFVALGDVDGDGALDAIALATSAATAAVFLQTASGLEAAGSWSVPCSQPRAARAFSAEGAAATAIGCDGELLIAREISSETPSFERLDADGSLYDVAAAEFEPGAGDGLATVSIASHAVGVRVVWDEPAFSHAVARGPVALAAIDADADGDADLIVLSLEERRLSFFENRSRTEQSW
ncbi:MAG: VCBS repeat-containing protein [Polyangiaceae bacterium]